MSSSPLNSRWLINSGQAITSLAQQSNIPISAPTGTQCLVRIEYASLNYRDIAIANGSYPWPLSASFTPLSDAAGQIIATGPQVTHFTRGDRVMPLFMQSHQTGPVTPRIRLSTLGSQLDGVLQKYALFDESGLIAIPTHLTYAEASTLPCAAVTAWNCLFGLPSHILQPDQVMLTQGTGGVSLFAIQFALAIGATVISTTSTPSKEAYLRSLGVKHVINYRDDLHWGETAKALTPGALGVHHIVEVGGETTIAQSMQAIRPEGVVSLVGFLGGKVRSAGASPGFSSIQDHSCIVRGVNVGSRELFGQMNMFLEREGIKPVLSDRVFGFDEAKEAYDYMQQQNFVGKIVIKVSDESRLGREFV